MRRFGFDMWMHKNVGNKLFIAASAGSIVMIPSVDVAAIEPGDIDLPGHVDLCGLGFVNVGFEPHCDKQRFRVIQHRLPNNKRTIVAVNDKGAMTVINGRLQAVGKNTSQLCSNGEGMDLSVFSR